MIRRNRDVSRPNFNQTNPKCANRRASYLKTNLARAFRATAPALFALTFASVAHAQGKMDFSGAQTLMGTFKTCHRRIWQTARPKTDGLHRQALPGA